MAQDRESRRRGDRASFLKPKPERMSGPPEERFVKTFSRFIGGELYARNWEKPKPETQGPGKSSRSSPAVSRISKRTWRRHGST